MIAKVIVRSLGIVLIAIGLVVIAIVMIVFSAIDPSLRDASWWAGFWMRLKSPAGWGCVATGLLLIALGVTLFLVRLDPTGKTNRISKSKIKRDEIEPYF